MKLVWKAGKLVANGEGGKRLHGVRKVQLAVKGGKRVTWQEQEMRRPWWGGKTGHRQRG